MTEEFILTKGFAKSGDPIICINNNPLQDKQDPKKSEYEGIKENKIDGEVSLVLVYGHAFGYTVDAVLEVHPEAEAVIVYEPVVELFNMTVPEREDLFHNPKVYLANSLNIYISQLESLYNTEKNIAIYSVPGWTQFFKVPFEEFLNVTQRRLNILNNLKKHVIKDLQTQDAENILRNLPKHTVNPELKDVIHVGNKKPVIICSDGKSLQDNLEFLKEKEDKVLIIGTDKSFPILTKAGIKVHFTVVTDPTETAYNNLKELDTSVTTLVNPLTANYKLKDLSFASTFTFASLNTTYKSWVFSKLQEQFSFDIGMFVDHTAFSLGIILGCSPVVLLGFDHADSEPTYLKWLEASYTTLMTEMKHEVKLLNASNVEIQGYEKISLETMWENLENPKPHLLDVKLNEAKCLPWQKSFLGETILETAKQIEGNQEKELKINPLYTAFASKGKGKEFVKILQEISVELNTYLAAEK